ncbi:MAG: phosphate ABC transporter substrate-binding/OmpA family protein [Candidatus Contendobacter sp.]
MKTDNVAEKPVDHGVQSDRNSLEMLTLIWVIKRGLERPGDRVIQLSQLRKDRQLLKAVLDEASESADSEIRQAAARIRELMAQNISLDPSMDLESPATMGPKPTLDQVAASRRTGGASYLRPLLAALTLGVMIGLVVIGGWKWLDGAGVAPRTVAPTVPSAPAQVVLRIHGSNTLGAELLPALAEAFLRKEGARTVQRIKTAANEWRVEGVINRLTEPVAIEIKAHGSGTAFTGIGAGLADIGASSRPIKKEEAGALSRFGDMTLPAFEHVIGLDGLAVIVNKSNKVRALTKAQIARIFAGAVTDWTEVGGDPGPVRLYARDEKSGTFDTFQHVVMGKDKIADKAARLESSSELSDKVAADTFGIGFIGLPYVRNARAIAVADGESLPMLPTSFTVATEDYPLARRLYLYTPSNSQNPYIRDFTEFALSERGQQLVGDNGFVSQLVVATKQPVQKSFPSKYVELIQNAQRLSLSFRFRPEDNALDSKAQRDLDRVIDFLARNPGQRLMLLGFTDNNGDSKQNLEISRVRAQAVERELATRGIFPVVVDGFGPALPVANNASPQGAEKNRRVEIWAM